VALSTAALASGAAAGAKTVFYGGGALPGKGREQLLALSRTGAHRVTVLGNVADNGHLARCGAVFISKSHLLVHADRSFSASGPIIEGATGQSGTYRLKGRLKGSDEAVGTARATYTLGHAACDTGTIHWHVYAPSVGRGSGRLKSDAVYGGVTSQASGRADVRLPVMLRLDHARTSVVELTASINNFCQNDPSHANVASGVFNQYDLFIDKGRIHGGTAGQYPLSSTQTAYFTQEVHGSFTRHRITGDWKVTVVIKNNNDGSTADTCGGDTKTWQASRTGR
jgi:hypothetical protein